MESKELQNLTAEVQKISQRLNGLEQSVNNILQLQANVVKSQLSMGQTQIKLEESVGKLEQTVLKVNQTLGGVVASMVKFEGKFEEIQVMQAKSVQKIETVVTTGKAMEKTPEEMELLKPQKKTGNYTIDESAMTRTKPAEKKMSLDDMLREGLRRGDR